MVERTGTGRSHWKVVSLKASLRPFHHIWYVRVVIRVARLYCFACKVRFRLCGKKEPQLTNFFSSVLWILTTFQPARGHTNCCNDDNSRTTSWNRHYLRTKSPNWTVSVTTGGNNGNSGYLRWNRAVFKVRRVLFFCLFGLFMAVTSVYCAQVWSLSWLTAVPLCAWTFYDSSPGVSVLVVYGSHVFSSTLSLVSVKVY